MLNKPPPDVPSGVVIGVQFLSAFQTLKLITATAVLVRESALTVTTSLKRVGRSHLIHVNPVFLGFVFDVVVTFADRPLPELTGVRDALSNVLSGSRTG